MSHSVIDLTVPDGSWWFLMFRDPSGVVPRSLCQAPNIPKLCSWWIGSCPTMPEISSNDSTCPEGDFGPSASSQPTSDSTETLLRLYWDSTEAAIGASSIHFHSTWPKFRQQRHCRIRSFRHLCLAFSSLKTSSFSMSSARRASWDIIWSDCWHRLHLP